MNFRLAVAVEENMNMEPKVAEHFGHCSKFNVYEVDDKQKIIKVESYNNPLSGHQGGACQLPAYIRQFGINAIIAGGMGSKAVALFQSFGIEVITAPGLIIEQAVDKYLKGNLKGYTECANHDHEHNC